MFILNNLQNTYKTLNNIPYVRTCTIPFGSIKHSPCTCPDKSNCSASITIPEGKKGKKRTKRYEEERKENKTKEKKREEKD